MLVSLVVAGELANVYCSTIIFIQQTEQSMKICTFDRHKWHEASQSDMDESPCRRTVEKRHCCLESWTSHMHFGGLKDSSNHHCQSPRSKQIDSRHPHVAWNTERHWWIGPISDSGPRRLWWPTLVHRFLPKFQALEHLGRLQLATIGVFHQCNRIR